MRFLVLIIFSCLFTQELEVEGNLKVTGTIQNDSLMLIIADLQAQIAALQAQLAAMQVNNKLETRVYDIENLYWDASVIDFNVLLGFEYEYFILEILDVIPFSIPSGSVNVRIQNSLFDQYGLVRGVYYPWNLNTFTWDDAGTTRGLFINNGEDIIFSTGAPNTWTIKISVTAQFPE